LSQGGPVGEGDVERQDDVGGMTSKEISTHSSAPGIVVSIYGPLPFQKIVATKIVAFP
jgi:hypothetical protein